MLVYKATTIMNVDLSHYSFKFFFCLKPGFRTSLAAAVYVCQAHRESASILPSGPAHARTIKALQDALKKALKWNEALISGKQTSMHALAKEQGISPQYVGHLIKLAWLSPDIIRAILKGQVPATLSLDQLKKGFPLDWDEQRKVLRFSA